MISDNTQAKPLDKIAVIRGFGNEFKRIIKEEYSENRQKYHDKEELMIGIYNGILVFYDGDCRITGVVEREKTFKKFYGKYWSEVKNYVNDLGVCEVSFLNIFENKDFKIDFFDSINLWRPIGMSFLPLK